MSYQSSKFPEIELDSKSCEDLINAVHLKSLNDDQEKTSGEVLFTSNEKFEQARTCVWNLDTAGMPIVIVKCASANDVAAAIAFSKHNSLKICVHSAGAHSSQAVVDKSVVVDLSLLRDVKVNVSTKTVLVAGGATIGDVDRATKPHGLALPMGHVHHTGVAGMALNATSGIGYLTRTRSLTVSYLKSATFVMADGSVKKISEKEHKELLWAIRGAGSNFGVAIELEFSLTNIAPKVFAGDLVKFGKGTGPGKMLCCLDSDKTREDIINNWFKFFNQEDTPNECSSLMVIAANGPVISRICYIPTENDSLKSEKDINNEAKQVYKPLIDFGFNIQNSTKMMEYHDGLQKLAEFNPSYFYQKAVNTTFLTEKQISTISGEFAALADECPVTNMGSGIIVQPIGGTLASMDIQSTATAQVFKTMKWWIIIIVEFPEGPNDIELRKKCVEWVREVYKAVEPYALKDNGRQEDACTYTYGATYGSENTMKKLKELKAKYDPQNTFSLNRNILP